MGSECRADPTGKEDVSIQRGHNSCITNPRAERECIKQIVVPDFASFETGELKPQARSASTKVGPQLGGIRCLTFPWARGAVTRVVPDFEGSKVQR